MNFTGVLRQKRNDHAEEEADGESEPVDFAWLVFMGMQMGYTEKEISRMYMGKWCDLFQHFKWFCNFKARRCVFKEKKRVSMLDL